MSINIKLLDYQITNDEKQFILSKVRQSEKGNENLKVIGYYALNKPNLLLNAIKNDYVFNNEEELTSFNQVRERYLEVLSLLEDVNERLINNVKGD